MIPSPPTTGFDLNCDLGEGEPRSHTRALIERIDSANIAAGGHAGNLDSIRFCLEEARRHGTHAGAHPGLANRHDFGRGPTGGIRAEDLVALLEAQVGRVADLATELGVTLHHVKLHGALYHTVESAPDLAIAYLECVRRCWPSLVVYARCGGLVTQLAVHVPSSIVWGEGFLDRGYADDGNLIPRDQPGALLTHPAEVRQRLQDLTVSGRLRTVTGTWFPLRPRTLCVHGDSPHALEFLDAIRPNRRCALDSLPQPGSNLESPGFSS